MTTKHGRDPSGRATHERSQSALSPPSVSIPDAALLALAARCERISKPSVELNIFIHHALKYHSIPVPPFTASADAALLLVPEGGELAIYTHWALTRGFPQNEDGSWTITEEMPRGVWVRTYGGDEAHKNCQGTALTLPLALCAIGLRMRAASVDRSPEGEKPQALNAQHESAVAATSGETPSTKPGAPDNG